MEAILMMLAKYGGIIATLIAGILYFIKKENSYVIQIENLNKELRDNERETLELIKTLTITLDKVIAAENGTKVEVLNELKMLKETILIKIDALKK